MNQPDSNLDRSDYELLDLLAFIYLENNQPEKAVILLETIQQLNQADSRQLTALAWAQLNSGKQQAALKTINQAIQQGEDIATLHFVRARILLALSMRPAAIAAMKTYIELRNQA